MELSIQESANSEGRPWRRGNPRTVIEGFKPDFKQGRAFIFPVQIQKGVDMGEKGKRDKAGREPKKKPQKTIKEKRKEKKEKKK
jgi:hypothetical protein